MTQNEMAVDSLGLNRRLTLALTNPAIPQEFANPDRLDNKARVAFLHVAEAIGKIRLFDTDVDPRLDGTLPIPMALVAVQEATREAQSLLRDLEELKDRMDTQKVSDDPLKQESSQIYANEAAIQIMERRLALVAVREATEEAYYAADNDSEMLQRLQKALEYDLGVNEKLDERLSGEIQLLLPVRQTNLLNNWFALLREPYRLMAQKWWFFEEDRWLSAKSIHGQ